MRTPARRQCLAAFTLVLIASTPSVAMGQECPSGGGTLEVVLVLPDGVAASDAIVAGTLDGPSCTNASSVLATSYLAPVTCTAGSAGSCRARFTQLHPGRWTHRLLAADAGQTTQVQARPDLVLSADAGVLRMEWPLYRSVLTVTTLSDDEGCVGCLRDVLTLANAAAKPALVQFASHVSGSIVLRAALPALETGAVTIDGFDFDGRAYQRTIDANGLGAPTLVIRSAFNAIAGLRLTNVGRNSDVVLIEGAGADANLLDSLQVVGRAQQPCGASAAGCVIDGQCRTPQTDPLFGVCGDDGIAVRQQAGVNQANVVRGCEVLGAFDKGVKVSEEAVARVERCLVHNNRDGGLQATTSGQLTAVENWVHGNQGTVSANGIAANGSAPGVSKAARLTTQGNISEGNSLRGISVRGLSTVDLAADYACGNSAGARAFGLAILDAAAVGASVRVGGLASVYNGGGGVSVSGTSAVDLGGLRSLGNNAFAFNGPASAPRNVENSAMSEVSARNNQWQHCGVRLVCDNAAIADSDVHQATGAGPVIIEPPQPNHRRARPHLTQVTPSFAEEGDIVRIYGTGFDAIDGNGPALSCETISSANSCKPLRGNCVMIDRQPAEVLAVTPTMLVIRAPISCVTPVTLAVRTRYGRGFARTPFCVLPERSDDASPGPLLAQSSLTRSAAAPSPH